MSRAPGYVPDGRKPAAVTPAWGHYTIRPKCTLRSEARLGAGDAGIPGGEDRRRRLVGRPCLGARSGREAVQVRLRAAAQLVGGANDPRRLRRRRPGAGGVRRSDPGGALRCRAATPRRANSAAALAERRHDARANGRDPRDPCHSRSQDNPAAGLYSRCTTRRPARRGSRAACFRSTSPLASSP